jgi:hypothetical protein
MSDQQQDSEQGTPAFVTAIASVVKPGSSGGGDNCILLLCLTRADDFSASHPIAAGLRSRGINEARLIAS